MDLGGNFLAHLPLLIRPGLDIYGYKARLLSFASTAKLLIRPGIDSSYSCYCYFVPRKNFLIAIGNKLNGTLASVPLKVFTLKSGVQPGKDFRSESGSEYTLLIDIYIYCTGTQ
jgi:hypothetical protein